MFSVNGKAWPYTERLTHKVGETVRWRWINTRWGFTDALHGSYYAIDSVGDGNADTIYAADDRRLVVTEVMNSGGTMATTWVPERPGRWLFHCHILAICRRTEHLAIWRGEPCPRRRRPAGVRSGMKGWYSESPCFLTAKPLRRTRTTRCAQIRLLVRERPATGQHRARTHSTAGGRDRTGAGECDSARTSPDSESRRAHRHHGGEPA